MTHEELTGPFTPWRPEMMPVDNRQAIAIISNGWHAQAMMYGRNYERDQQVIELLEKNLVTCAYNPAGMLAMKPTLLAHVQRWN